MTVSTMNAEVADLCDVVADQIAEHGWQQYARWHGSDMQDGSYPGGSTCAIGAVCVVTGEVFNGSWDVNRTDPVVDAVLNHLGVYTDDLAEWNDEDGRTAAEVIQAFRDTATKLRSDEFRCAPGGGGAA